MNDDLRDDDEDMPFEEEMLDRLARLEIMLEALLTGRPHASKEEALDKYGSPKVRFDPKSYRGGSFKGAPLKECPSDFLEHYAATLESFAVKEDAENKTYKGKPASLYTRLDASRARRWALMKRLGDFEEPARREPTHGFGGGATGPGFGGGHGFGGGGGFSGGGLGGAPPAPNDGGNGEDLYDVDDEIPF